MPDRFTPLPLAMRQVDQAFPLVQSILPDITVDVWRRYAAALLDRAVTDRGIMTVQALGYIHGLFSFRVEDNLQHGRSLLVDNFSVLDLFTPTAAATALVRSMDELAVTLDCRAIHTYLPNSERLAPDYRRWMLRQFRDHGHHVESVTLCKASIPSDADRDPAGHDGGRIRKARETHCI